MKLTVIGSSSAGNGYLLTTSTGETLVLECGCSLKEIKYAMNFKISGIVGALSSHLHGDHSKYIKQYSCTGIRVYTSLHVAQNHKDIKELPENRILKPGEQARIGSFKILPFEVKHDVPCLGFLLYHPEMGTCLFVTDTHYIPNTFRGLNHILIECNYEHGILNDNLWNGIIDSGRYERTQRSHMSLETCIEALRKNNLNEVRNIVLIHLSPQNSDVDMFRSRVVEATGKTVYVAKKGLIVDFNKDPY